MGPGSVFDAIQAQGWSPECSEQLKEQNVSSLASPQNRVDHTNSCMDQTQARVLVLEFGKHGRPISHELKMKQ